MSISKQAKKVTQNTEKKKGGLIKKIQEKKIKGGQKKGKSKKRKEKVRVKEKGKSKRKRRDKEILY